MAVGMQSVVLLRGAEPCA